jgi:hypothetical protein
LHPARLPSISLENRRFDKSPSLTFWLVVSVARRSLGD